MYGVSLFCYNRYVSILTGLTFNHEAKPKIKTKNVETLQLSLARSIARQAVRHSCSSGEGTNPATLAPGVCPPPPLCPGPKAGKPAIKRACHQLWSSFDIT